MLFQFFHYLFILYELINLVGLQTPFTILLRFILHVGLHNVIIMFLYSLIVRFISH